VAKSTSNQDNYRIVILNLFRLAAGIGFAFVIFLVFQTAVSGVGGSVDKVGSKTMDLVTYLVVIFPVLLAPLLLLGRNIPHVLAYTAMILALLGQVFVVLDFGMPSGLF